jgi:DNA-binding MarR family transcriptional regulator
MAYTSKSTNTFKQKIIPLPKTVRQQVAFTPVDIMKEIASICQKEVDLFFEKNNIPDGYRALLVVLGKEDGISQLNIANHIGLKPSTISITLKKMERDGLIVRQNDENDQRMSRVYLTEHGQCIADKLYALSDTTYQLLMNDISEEELASVMKVAEKMKSNFENFSKNVT